MRGPEQQSFWGTCDVGVLKASQRWWADVIKRAEPGLVCTREMDGEDEWSEAG